MTEFKLLDYRIGIAGRIAAILTGLIALGLYFYQGELGELTQNILMSIALIGMVLAIHSKELNEDERMDIIRMRTAIYALTSFIGVTGIMGLWLHKNNFTNSPVESLSMSAYAIFALGFYLIVLEISKRIA